MRLIKMYRKMINDSEFSENMEHFFDRHYIKNRKGKKLIEDTWSNIKEKIEEVLNEWEDYGYSFFMYERNKIIPKPKSLT